MNVDAGTPLPVCAVAEEIKSIRICLTDHPAFKGCTCCGCDVEYRLSQANLFTFHALFNAAERPVHR